MNIANGVLLLLISYCQTPIPGQTWEVTLLLQICTFTQAAAIRPLYIKVDKFILKICLTNHVNVIDLDTLDTF